MNFVSLSYLLFLPVVFLIYWSLKGKTRLQNAVLLAASMVFYGEWSMACLALLMATCLANYLLSRAIERHTKGRKAMLALALVTDFAILGVFKYYDFFVSNMAELMSLMGFQPHMTTLGLVLPIGISFYTFQLAGYVVDSYRRQLTVSHSMLDFFAFITFFPQLVAGPIERGNAMLPQFTSERRFSFTEARDGMRQMLWGLVKKLLIADNCATQVDVIFADYTNCSALDLWAGALFFTFQIYGDFSGYCDIAIGSAKLFGFHLSDNFMRPYFSKSVPEFWRRWHMTLMTWFRDYLYIPLGGSRRGATRKKVNTLVVFLFSGLWHGSNWTYVAWGVYHALWFVIPHRFITFIVVMIGWVIFRSPDMTTAFSYICRMFNPTLLGPIHFGRLPLLLIGALVLTEWRMGDVRHPFAWREEGWQKSQLVRMSVYLVLFLSAMLFGGEKVQFIYFQF